MSSEAVSTGSAERAAEPAEPAASAAARPGGSIGLFGSELLTLFRRRRTWARLGALALIPVLIGVAIRVAGDVRVRGFETERRSLEQRFIDLTGEGFDVVQ